MTGMEVWRVGPKIALPAWCATPLMLATANTLRGGGPGRNRTCDTRFRKLLTKRGESLAVHQVCAACANRCANVTLAELIVLTVSLAGLDRFGSAGAPCGLCRWSGEAAPRGPRFGVRRHPEKRRTRRVLDLLAWSSPFHSARDRAIWHAQKRIFAGAQVPLAWTSGRPKFCRDAHLRRPGADSAAHRTISG